MALAAGFGIAFSGYASAVIQVGIDKLVEVLATEFSTRFQTNLEQEIRRLRRLMTTISNFLNEFSGSNNDKGMLLWLRELRHIAFTADKLIDELHVMFRADSIGRTPTTRFDSWSMASKISKFIISSQEILKERKDFDEFIPRDRTVTNFGRTMPQTSTFLLDPEVFGREDEKQIILQIIASNLQNRSLSVIPILGMAGIGKTTLARYVFTDPRIGRSFAVKSWVSLGVDFDLTKTTRMILECITGESYGGILSFDKLQQTLHRVLRGRKFLIVLDGVWNENQDDWNKLLGPLLPSDGSEGSVVLLTTQSRKVASTLGTTAILRPRVLSLEDCGSIFWKHACKEEKACKDQELRDIGRDIIIKCRGIPALAKTFGNLLWMKTEKIEWKFILDCDICHLPDVENEVLSGLRLSFSMLPVHLQPYITYCAIFPRGHKLEKYTLIQLWMAEELLKTNGRVRMEDVGKLCFEELVDRSFFEKTDKADLYTINWLMYEMLQLVASDDAFRALVDLSSNESPPHNETLVRYLFVESNVNNEGLERFAKFKNLRLLFSARFTPVNITYTLSNVLLESIKFIRVLDLSDSGITLLPPSINRLKFLRYFNLSNTQLSEICEALSDLGMLQTLKLRGCAELQKLPASFWRLYNMRALEIDTKDDLVPRRVGRLTMLQELKLFVVRKQVGYTLCELQNLVELHGSLCILGIENASTVDEASSASLRNKEHLSQLQLQWGEHQDRFENEEKILENLQPHHNLKRLTITGYHVHKLPNWGWSSPSNLVEIELIDCINLQCIEQLNRLRSLKILRLRGNNVVQEINNGFFGLQVDNVETAFCSLEIIHLDGWSVLTRWSTVHIHAFKLLNRIVIHNCLVLETVPDFKRFESLKSLEFDTCPELKYSQGTRDKRVQLVYEACPHLGGSSGARRVQIWGFSLPFNIRN